MMRILDNIEDDYERNNGALPSSRRSIFRSRSIAEVLRAQLDRIVRYVRVVDVVAAMPRPWYTHKMHSHAHIWLEFRLQLVEHKDTAYCKGHWHRVAVAPARDLR